MKHILSSRTQSRPQRGVALFSTLVILVVVMFIGIAAVMSSRGQFGLSGNGQYKAMAFSAAESAVIAAEQWLSTPGNLDDPRFQTRAKAGGLYPAGYLASINRDPTTMVWNSATSEAGPSAEQRYMIELLAENQTLMSSGESIGSHASGIVCNTVNTYRIVARGESNRGSTEFIQSIYSVLNC